MSVWELYTQLFARKWRCGRFVRSLSQGCSEKIRKKDVVMTAGRWLSWSIQIPLFLMLWWPAMKAGSTAMTQRLRDRVPSGSILALPDLSLETYCVLFVLWTVRCVRWYGRSKLQREKEFNLEREREREREKRKNNKKKKQTVYSGSGQRSGCRSASHG